MKTVRAPAALTGGTALLLCLSAADVAHAEWMLTGFLGAANTRTAPITISQPESETDVTLASVHYRGESFTSPLYYGFRLTWFSRAAPSLGVETEFIHPKVYADPAHVTQASGRIGGALIDQSVVIGSVVQRFSISHGLNMLLFNAVARHAFGSGGSPPRFVVAGRIGAGPTIPHVESTIAGRPSPEAYAWGALVWQAAAGVQVRLVRRLDVVGEYKFTRTHQSVDIARGTVEGIFASHHVVFGLSWHITQDR